MKYINYKKNELDSISIENFKTSLPNLKNVNKTEVLSKWLMERIDAELKNNSFSYGQLLPKKAEFAYAFGVSLGTVQNVLRILEDNDYIYSKQCIGSILKNRADKESNIRKQTSKKDFAEEKIKQFIMDNKLLVGAKLPVSRQLSKEIDVPLNTLRSASSSLISGGILEYNNNKELIIKNIDFNINDKVDETTLVLKVKEDLKKHISKNYKVGDKLEAHNKLAKMFNVSMKTIHNAIQLLVKENMLLPRRGAYGTIVINTSEKSAFEPRREMSIFAPAKETAHYHYQKIQAKIKNIIAQNYDIGSKLPSINEFSQVLEVSPNIIRKALSNLSKSGIVRFTRGRYGGTYVIDIPETNEQTFRWLAVNPQYAGVDIK